MTAADDAERAALVAEARARAVAAPLPRAATAALLRRLLVDNAQPTGDTGTERRLALTSWRSRTGTDLDTGEVIDVATGDTVADTAAGRAG